jgi:hypothetical protein
MAVVSDTSANPVFDAAMAYQRTAALVAAVKLDIFTAIGSGTTTSDDLASKIGASARGLRILCDFLTVMELLKKKDSNYRLTHAARILLDGSSPFAMGSIVDFVAAPEMLALFLEDPASYVQNGRSKGPSNVDPDHPVWVRYARAMVPFAATTAKLVAGYVTAFPIPPKTVLDVAAGHGLYGIEVAKALPNAEVTAVDWEGVLAVARGHAEAAGVGHRFHTLAGNALNLEWGHFDLILLPNFLHHFDVVPNEDRISPPVPAMFAFWMLASTPGGDAYTARELDEMARNAGFRAATTRPLPPTPQNLIVFEN